MMNKTLLESIAPIKNILQLRRMAREQASQSANNNVSGGASRRKRLQRKHQTMAWVANVSIAAPQYQRLRITKY